MELDIAAAMLFDISKILWNISWKKSFTDSSDFIIGLNGLKSYRRNKMPTIVSMEMGVGGKQYLLHNKVEQTNNHRFFDNPIVVADSTIV